MSARSSPFWAIRRSISTMRPVASAPSKSLRPTDSGMGSRPRPYSTAGTNPSRRTFLTAFLPTAERDRALRLIRSIGKPSPSPTPAPPSPRPARGIATTAHYSTRREYPTTAQRGARGALRRLPLQPRELHRALAQHPFGKRIGVRLLVHDPHEPGVHDHLGARQARLVGGIDRRPRDADAVVRRLNDRVLFRVQA